MGIGLAGEEEVKAVPERASAERLMGVEVVAQEGDLAGVIAGGVLIQPALSGPVYGLSKPSGCPFSLEEVRLANHITSGLFGTCSTPVSPW